MIWLVASAWAHDPNVPPLTVPEGTVAIDGDLGDAAWAAAPVITDLLRFRPSDGGPPPGATEVRLLHDEHYFYVSVKVRDAERPVRARVSPREDINDDDQIGVYLDPFDLAQNGFVFYFNARGIQQDIRAEGPSYDGWNFAWDTVLRAEGHVTDDGHGFDLEIGIPFRSIKYPDGGQEQRWGFLVTRKIPGDGAKYSWPKMDRNAPRIFPQAAPIVITPPKNGSGVELIPGLAGGAQREVADDHATWTGSDPVRLASLDLRYGITPSTGVGVTVNPDFSNVEFDATQIDLNHRYPFSYAEHRPFFLDGAGYLDDDIGTLHSRTIVSPLYAVKAYSQSGEWSTGVLHALDTTPSESVNTGGSPGFGTFYDGDDSLADADALTTVARLSRSLGDGGHAAVMMLSKDIVRGGTDGDPVHVDAHHELGGLDVAVPVSDATTVSTLVQTSYTSDFADALMGLSAGASVDYSADTTFNAYGYGSTRDFRRETGLLYSPGEAGGGVSLGRNLEPGFVDAMSPWVSADASSESGYRTGSFELGNWAQKGAKQGSIGLGGRREWVDGLDPIDGGYAWVEGSADLGALFSFSGELGADRGMVWGEGGPGTSAWTWWGCTLRPTPGFRADLSWEGQRTSQTLVSSSWDTSQAWRGTFHWQFDRAVGARLIEEYADSLERGRVVTSSLLVTALKNPGTALYVGASEVRSLDAPPDPSAPRLVQTVFAKGTVLLRL